MNKTELTCEIITPLSIGSAFTNKLELRPPALKGAMRFWWRALNGDLSIKNLKLEEGKIFGTSDEKIGRSKFSLRMYASDLEVKQYSPVFHRSDRGRIPAFKPGQEFNIVMTSLHATTEQHHSFEDILLLTLMLGGLGKRSRRGFGCVYPTKVNTEIVTMPITASEAIERIYSLLNKIKPGAYSIHNSKITIKPTAKFNGNYPWVKEIIIGKEYVNYNELLKAIGSASHDFCSDYLGYARQGRFSSPIYVSVMKVGEEYSPIITTLNTVFDRKHMGPNTQQQFKEAIL